MRLIPDDVVVVGALPDIPTKFRIAQAFEGRDILRDDLVRRGRRPRRPVPTEILHRVNTHQQMYMIRHNHIFYRLHIGIYSVHLPDPTINHDAKSTQVRRRGVEDAAPYDLRQQTFPILRANSDKICSVLAVKLRT